MRARRVFACVPRCANAAAVHDCGLGHNTPRCVVRCRAAGARATGCFSPKTFICSMSSLTLSSMEPVSRQGLMVAWFAARPDAASCSASVRSEGRRGPIHTYIHTYNDTYISAGVYIIHLLCSCTEFRCGLTTWQGGVTFSYRHLTRCFDSPADWLIARVAVAVIS